MTEAEEILRGIAAIQRQADGEGPAAAAIDAGADALALLRALPEWDHVGYCAFSKCEGHESFSDEPALPHSADCPRHHKTCPWHKITALLTRAGRA